MKIRSGATLTRGIVRLAYCAGMFFIFLLSAFTSVQAQRINGFVSSGITFSQIEGDELKGFRKYGYTGGVGALTAISSNGRWGLSIEALFSQRGTYDNSGDPYAMTMTLNYVDIPLLVHYQDPHGGMLVGAGVTYGRLVAQPNGTILFNKNSMIPDTSDMTFNHNDVCATIDARFTVWKGLQLNLRWQYSIMAIKRQWHFDIYRQGRWIAHDNDCFNNAITLRLIYQF